MIATQDTIMRENLTPRQKQTFEKFKNKLAQNLPTYRIAWVLPFNDTIIELHLEAEKRSYRNNLKASKLAMEVEDETDITIIFR